MNTVRLDSLPKVLVVSPTPPPFSGPEIMTQHLLNSSLKDRYQLIHFNISKQRDVADKARFDVVNIFYGIIQPIQLLWLMLRYRPDIVYTNFAQNLGGFLRYASFILIVALFGKPVVVRVMGDGFNHFYRRSPFVLRKLIHFVLEHITIFIVRAETLKQQFAGLVPPEKLWVVYSGIDVEEFNVPRNREDDGLLRVLFVGYLTKAKGALDLLQTVPKVVAKIPNVRFQLMGARLDIERNISYVDNPESNEAILDRLLADPSIASHVELLGQQSGDQKVKTFVDADVFILPSYSEAFPTVVLEAMAAGLPVVATPVGVLPEAFDENHILFVQPGNLDGISQALIDLLADCEMRRMMGLLNRNRASHEFTLSAYADRVDEVFRYCLRVGEKQDPLLPR
jgi:glycosyltransferase involved in cell wall biosynthesis